MSHDVDDDGAGSTVDSSADFAGDLPPDEAEGTGEFDAADQHDQADEYDHDDFGPPFAAKTFGGAFVWARSPGYVATVLRIREGQNVAISTQNRRDMTVMLTAGRAVLEVQSNDGTDRVEVMPASPIVMDPGSTHRLLAMTEVELFTIYMPLPA